MRNRERKLGLYQRVLACEGGATSIEYALIAGVISVTVIAWATHIGDTLNNTFNSVGSNLD